MKILIDGDSSRVVRNTERMAKRYQIACHIYCDTNHALTSDYSTIHIVDCQKDSADFAIVNNCDSGDIVVTSDGGLAAMALAKKARVLNPYGGEYTQLNIARVLTRRAERDLRVRKGSRRKKMSGSGLHPKETYWETLYKALTCPCVDGEPV